MGSNLVAAFNILLLLLVHIGCAAGKNCPKPCGCSETSNAFLEGGVYRVAECNGRNLSDFPKFTKYSGLLFEQVLLDGNRIANVPSAAFTGVKVKMINFTGNANLQLSDHAFRGVTGVTELYLSRCGLQSAPGAIGSLSKLQKLDLSHNDIAHLSLRAFKNLTSLWWLDLSFNKVRFLASFQSFDGLKALGYLNLANCHLANLPPLDHLANLTTLIARNNKIQGIPDEAFANNQKLEELDLVDNKLQPIKTTLLQGLGRLKTLKFSHCELNEFNKVAFGDLISLETLVLRHCKISTIPDKPFERFKDLSYLDISHNLFELRSDLFAGVTGKLQHLRLDGMNLTTFPSDLVRPMRRLQVLTLNDNDIVLPAGTFRGLPKRVQIHMKNNGLTSGNISTEVFDDARRPIGLYLQDNNITSLEFITQGTCKFNGVVLDLSRNPVFCDCEVYRMIQQKIFDLRGQCTAPKEYEDKKLLYSPIVRRPGQYLEKAAFGDCKGSDRTGDRYECTCQMWMPYELPKVCGGCGLNAGLVTWCAAILITWYYISS